MTVRTQVRNALLETWIEAMTCPTCGTVYGLGSAFRAERRKDHGTWYCPNGHPLHFPEKNTEELAIAERDAARSLAERESRRRKNAEQQAKLAEYQRRAAKGQVTKIRNRLARGLCPCCGQAFPELETHMTEAHPDFVLPAETTEETPS